MDSPNPDSGEEYFHANTQLYNTIDDDNRFKIGEAVTALVTDYISTFTGEIGRQPPTTSTPRTTQRRSSSG
jgi:phospholipase C